MHASIDEKVNVIWTREMILEVLEQDDQVNMVGESVLVQLEIFW